MQTFKIEELLEELIKLQILALKNDRTQAQLLQELDALNFKPKRIADLIGSTPNAVRVNLHNIKKKNN